MSITRDEIPVKIIPLYGSPHKYMWVYTDAGTGDNSGGNIEFTASFQHMGVFGGQWLFDIKAIDAWIASYSTQAYGAVHVFPQTYGTYVLNDFMLHRGFDLWGDVSGHDVLSYASANAISQLCNVRFKPTGDYDHIGTYPFIKIFITNVNAKVAHAALMGMVYDERYEALYSPS